MEEVVKIDRFLFHFIGDSIESSESVSRAGSKRSECDAKSV